MSTKPYPEIAWLQETLQQAAIENEHLHKEVGGLKSRLAVYEQPEPRESTNDGRAHQVIRALMRETNVVVYARTAESRVSRALTVCSWQEVEGVRGTLKRPAFGRACGMVVCMHACIAAEPVIIDTAMPSRAGVLGQHAVYSWRPKGHLAPQKTTLEL